MAKFLLDFGQTWDMLTKSELEEALKADAATRAVVAGVKSVDAFFPASVIGTGQTTFTTPQGMVAAGFVWSVLNIGMELSAASSVRVYKGQPTGLGSAPVGNGRFVVTMANFITPSVQLSKGQLILRSGDQLSFFPPTGPPNILSLFITATSIPAERIGELLL